MTNQTSVPQKSRFLKVLLAIIFLIVLAVLAVIILTLRSLPSPKAIASVLRNTQIEEVKNSNPNLPTKNDLPEATAKPGQTTNEAIPKPGQDTSVDNDNVMIKGKTGADIVRKFLTEDPQDLRVCENLGKTRYFEVKNSENKAAGFESFLQDNMRQDSVSETFRYPIKAIFHDDAIAPLMNELLGMEKQNLNEQEQESTLSKMEFYARAIKAASSLYSRKEKFEHIADRAEHLGIIAKIAAKRPELLDDPRLRNFCEDMEKSIKANDEIDIQQERQEVLKLIEYSGLSNKDLDFDPTAYIKFRVQTSSTGINFSLSSKDSEQKKN